MEALTHSCLEAAADAVIASSSSAAVAAASAAASASATATASDEPFFAALEHLLARSRHLSGTLRLVGEPAEGDSYRDENPQNVFSVASHCLFGFLTTLDANALRLTCREARDAVTAHAWADAKTRIKGSLVSWRKCFPLAAAASVRFRYDLASADFVHLRGLRTVDMYNCFQEGVGDAAFAHISGVRVLDMSGCDQTTITSAIFASLRGISELSMLACKRSIVFCAEFKQLMRSNPSLKLTMEPARLANMLREQPGDLAVARIALRALHAALNDHSLDNASSNAAISNAVLAALASRGGNEEVAEHACPVLGYFASSIANESARHCIKALVKARAAHARSERIAENVCLALRFFYDNAARSGLIVECGTAAAVVAALKAHSSSKRVVSAACNALASRRVWRLLAATPLPALLSSTLAAGTCWQLPTMPQRSSLRQLLDSRASRMC